MPGHPGFASEMGDVPEITLAFTGPAKIETQYNEAFDGEFSGGFYEKAVRLYSLPRETVIHGQGGERTLTFRQVKHAVKPLAFDREMNLFFHEFSATVLEIHHLAETSLKLSKSELSAASLATQRLNLPGFTTNLPS